MDRQTDRERQWTERDHSEQKKLNGAAQQMTNQKQQLLLTLKLPKTNCVRPSLNPTQPLLSPLPNPSLTKVQYFFNFCKVFTNSPSLSLSLSSTDIIEAHKNQQLCSLTGVEGGHSLGGSLAVLRTLYAIGVRYMTLTSTCHTPWADSSSADAPTFNMKHGGLTIFGKVSPPSLSFSCPLAWLSAALDLLTADLMLIS